MDRPGDIYFLTNYTVYNLDFDAGDPALNIIGASEDAYSLLTAVNASVDKGLSELPLFSSKDEYLKKLNNNLDIESVNQIKTELFGKNGIVSNEFKKLGSVSQEERKKFASDLNFIKDNYSLDEITSKLLSIRKVKKEEITAEVTEEAPEESKEVSAETSDSIENTEQVEEEKAADAVESSQESDQEQDDVADENTSNDEENNEEEK